MFPKTSSDSVSTSAADSSAQEHLTDRRWCAAHRRQVSQDQIRQLTGSNQEHKHTPRTREHTNCCRRSGTLTRDRAKGREANLVRGGDKGLHVNTDRLQVLNIEKAPGESEFSGGILQACAH